MTYFEIMELFTYYGVDVAVLGIIASALTQILKTTLLKKAPNKVYTFLPFVLGLALYFAYAAFARCELFGSAEGVFYIAERGLSVGAAATMVYVIYEQFIRGSQNPENIKLLAVKALLEGYFEGDKLSEVLQIVQSVTPSATAGETAKAVEACLLPVTEKELGAAETCALAYMIAKILVGKDTSAAV